MNVEHSSPVSRVRRIFTELWRYRYFILSSVVTEFRTRFARSRWGGIWMVLHPLAQVLVYTLILSQVMQAKLPDVESQYAYPIYLLTGMLAWSLFSELTGRLLDLFISQGNLLKKLAFPRLALPLIAVGSSLINFLILLGVSYLVFLALGHRPCHGLIWLPLLIFLTLMLAVGIGLTLGILNVFIRDVGQMMGIVLQFWFWLTPVVYTEQIVPPAYRWILEANPLTGIVRGFRDVLLYDRVPQWGELLYPALAGGMMSCVALLLFLRAREEMIDVL